MNPVICLVLYSLIAVSVASHKIESILEKYQAECDKLIDIEPFLKNEKLVNLHIKCLLDESRCNSDGEKIKKAIKEALPDTCAKCTAKQKSIARKVMQFMYTNRRSDFDKVFEKFDPENQYKAKMMDFMNSEN